MSKKLRGTPDRVWLAGLGALAVAEQEGNDLFQQLVEKGREFADTGNKKVSANMAEFMDLLGRVKVRVGNHKAAPASARPHPLAEVQSAPRAVQKSSRSMDREAVAARQAKRLERAQKAVLKEFGSLDKPADFERLQRERRIFTVVHRNTTYVPSFQLDEAGHPRPAVAKVIQILEGDTSDWGLALWFTAANGWLDGKRPVDLLKDAPEEVIQAAEQEAAELVF